MVSRGTEAGSLHVACWLPQLWAVDPVPLRFQAEESCTLPGGLFHLSLRAKELTAGSDSIQGHRKPFSPLESLLCAPPWPAGPCSLSFELCF